MQNGLPSKSPIVSVVIAEANQLNCDLVESALRPPRQRVAVVGSAVDSGRASALLREMCPDVAMISARLGDGVLEGFRVLRDLHSWGLKTRAILLLDGHDQQMIVDAFRCGARGVVTRDEPLDVLCKCIHAVHQGQVWASSKQLEFVLSALGQVKAIHVQDAKGAALLSTREETVARLVAEGLTNREISRELKLSQHTVRNYLFHIFEKLGISSRIELVLYCLQSRTSEVSSCDKKRA